MTGDEVLGSIVDGLMAVSVASVIIPVFFWKRYERTEK